LRYDLHPGSVALCSLDEERPMDFRCALSRQDRLSSGILALLIGVCSVTSLTAFSQSAADNAVVSVNEPTGGTLENRQIAAQWQIHDGHLTGLVIHNKSVEESAQDSSMRLNGPFSLGLKEIGVLPASGLTIRGAAKVEHLTPNPAASRYTERLPGIAVHYQLDDPAGQFQADWALVLRQDSSYIRQVLTITAGSKPVPVSGIVLIDVRRSPQAAWWATGPSVNCRARCRSARAFPPSIPLLWGLRPQDKCAAVSSLTSSASARIPIVPFCITTVGSISASSPRTASRMRSTAFTPLGKNYTRNAA
jgi:hypothetical protein